MKIIFLLIVFVSFVFLQKETPTAKKKNNKDKIIFNNDESSDKYLELYDRSFELLNRNYVDSINESEIIKSGIKGLMKPLDPYTKLLEGNSKESYDVLRKGKYGGVGIQIGLRRDTLTVLAPMEDSPAYSEGINCGDQILMIDSLSTEGMSVKEAANVIKGEINSIVKLVILRPSSKEKLTFELKRDNISVKHVPYWGIDEDGVGYVRITRFSKNCAKDFKNALKDLKSDSSIDLKGLVIDLRGNSGGLLSNAIKILDYLTVRGEKLLTSKGKTNRSNKEWVSRTKPIIDIDVPIAVLINKSSASASEIVAGALQDLDRAVVIGQKSFGKGLVQHMYDLNDTITLKITTAKYYLPSGRLIQKEDYLDNGFLTDGLNDKDSLFISKSGRKLKGGGGISPDIKTSINKIPPYIDAIWKEGAFLSFASYYVPFHKDIKDPIHISNRIISEFKIFLQEYELNYTLPGEKNYLKLKKDLKNSPISINKYSKNISYGSKNSTEIENIGSYYKQLKSIQFSLSENQRWIKNGLLREFSRVLIGEKERIKASLIEDNDYKRAKEVLLNIKEYYKILEI